MSCHGHRLEALASMWSAEEMQSTRIRLCWLADLLQQAGGALSGLERTGPKVHATSESPPNNPLSSFVSLYISLFSCWHLVTVWIDGTWNSHLPALRNMKALELCRKTKSDFSGKSKSSKFGGSTFWSSQSEQFQVHTPGYTIPPLEQIWNVGTRV